MTAPQLRCSIALGGPCPRPVTNMLMVILDGEILTAKPRCSEHHGRHYASIMARVDPAVTAMTVDLEAVRDARNNYQLQLVAAATVLNMAGNLRCPDCSCSSWSVARQLPEKLRVECIRCGLEAERLTSDQQCWQVVERVR